MVELLGAREEITVKPGFRDHVVEGFMNRFIRYFIGSSSGLMDIFIKRAIKHVIDSLYASPVSSIPV